MSVSPSDFNVSVVEEFRANQGQVGGMFENTPLLLLHHIGAKSGESRVTPLAYLRDNGRFVIVAGNAGLPNNPDWYYNLKVHPEVTIELGTETTSATANEVTGPERERLFQTVAAQAEQVLEYQANVTRVLPVIVLTPLADA